MRALALCCLLSCLSSSALAVHHPLHKHRHDKEKRTEVLVVKEDTNVEDIEETVYLPGPPPEGYGQHPEDWKKDFKHVVYQSTTYTLPDGSVTVVSGPEPTNSGSGLSAGESTGVNSSAGSTPPSNPTTTSSAAGDSASDLSSGLLGGGEVSPSSTTNSAAASASLIQSNPEDATSSVVRYTASASTAANSPGATTTPVSSAVAANNSPATSAASSAAAPSQSGAYKFTALVVFGDNLSDNGNGSYAHNVAANNATDVVDGNTIYGARTWTDGPVAVSYLADLLGVPLTQNFAHGHAWGGSRAGATIDDTMVQSNFSASLADGPWYDHGEFSEPCWGAPSAKVQINDYLAGGVNKDALHSLWIGANDMDAAYGGTLAIGDTALNNKFADNISTKIPNLVSTLLNAGAPYVFVANLYPKNLAPLWPGYLGINTTSEWDAMGDIINSANTALEAALKAIPNAERVIYYDAFTFMSNLYANPGSAFPNIKDTNGFPAFCDGDPHETPFVLSINETTVDGVEIVDNWSYCFQLKHGDEWYWMQYLDPTSHAHQLVAQDMEETIKNFPFPS